MRYQYARALILWWYLNRRGINVIGALDLSCHTMLYSLVSFFSRFSTEEEKK